MQSKSCFGRDIKLLMLGAQKVLGKFCCTLTVGWLLLLLTGRNLSAQKKTLPSGHARSCVFRCVRPYVCFRCAPLPGVLCWHVDAGVSSRCPRVPAAAAVLEAADETNHPIIKKLSSIYFFHVVRRGRALSCRTRRGARPRPSVLKTRGYTSWLRL